MSQLAAKHADPGKPHAFVVRTDPGLTAAASGAMGRATTDLGGVAVASAYLRDDHRCGLEGCGRARSDDIHALAPD